MKLPIKREGFKMSQRDANIFSLGIIIGGFMCLVGIVIGQAMFR